MLGCFDVAGWGEAISFDWVSPSPWVLFAWSGFCLTSSFGVTALCGEIVALPEDCSCEAFLISGGSEAGRTIEVVTTGDVGVMLM